MNKIFVTSLAIATYLTAGTTHDYVSTPPGGLDIKNVPQFVIIGADDCGDPQTVRWMTNFLKDKKNPIGRNVSANFDGKPVKMAFYVNGVHAPKAAESWKEAYKAGHEIGNHTFSHFLDSNGENIDARLLSKDVWTKEIQKNDSVILAVTGMKKDELVGFRVPRLEYNRDAYLAMIERGFLYDCSIEEGGQPEMDGTNNFWPYTLDKGSLADSIMTVQSVGENDWGYKKIGAIPGLWQLPVYNFVVPHDSLSEKYGFEKGLRTRCHTNFDWFDTTTGNLTGFDYNIFAPSDWSGAAMNAQEYLATLKNSFDLHITGNRAPFALGMHPDFYAESANEHYSSAGDHNSRRKVIEDFINYTLTHKDVRYITGAQMINWMKSPIGLDGKKGK